MMSHNVPAFSEQKHFKKASILHLFDILLSRYINSDIMVKEIWKVIKQWVDILKCVPLPWQKLQR